MNFEQAVTQGAALLDTRFPRWHETIDLDRLDIASDTDCILGQLFGSFIKGRDHLFGDNTDSHRLGLTHGFNAPGDTEHAIDHWHENCAILENLWREAIGDRRGCLIGE